MTKDQLKEQINALSDEFERRKRVIYKEYALSNNPYKIGDIVTDHMGSVVVEKIQIHISDGSSSCVYTGKNLLKNGSQSKREPIRSAYQINIKGK